MQFGGGAGQFRAARPGEETMRVSLTNWLGLEFVEIGAEAPSRDSPASQAEVLFQRASRVLEDHGLSLSDTVRSRLFGRDRAARDAASEVRRSVLSGAARAATSSYIAPALFASDASVAMELIALRRAPGLDKSIRENDPPRLPCRYLTIGPLVMLSGQTAVLPGLEEQLVGDILPRVGAYLEEARSGWDRVMQLSCYLHASESAEETRGMFREAVGSLPERFEIRFVEGYSAEGKLIEVETTALRDA